MGQNNDEGNKGSEMAVGGRRRESDEHGEDLMEDSIWRREGKEEMFGCLI